MAELVLCSSMNKMTKKLYFYERSIRVFSVHLLRQQNVIHHTTS